MSLKDINETVSQIKMLYFREIIRPTRARMNIHEGFVFERRSESDKLDEINSGVLFPVNDESTTQS